MHANSLFPLQHFRLVRHHTRFVQRGLPVEKQDIAIPEVPEHLLASKGHFGPQPVQCWPFLSLARGEQLIRDCGSLLFRQFIL
jgi:hypothetical protein